MRGPPSTRTRLRAPLSAVSLAESHLACTPLSTILDAYDDALDQFCLARYDECSVMDARYLDAARLRLASTSPSIPPSFGLECLKATADVYTSLYRHGPHKHE
ncbi:hypothetical protein AB1Y20_005426 [Prymnesium parvum]|uniref:KIF-binding protein n=1 Tax=Prymnesium parvum TaxID=97485 RepID=A0AB34J3C0_PRYPA